MSQQQLIQIEDYKGEIMLEQNQQNQPQQIEIEDNNSEFSDDFQSDREQQVEIGQQEAQKIKQIPKVSNPISAYSLFVRGWKDNHPEEKMNMAMMGDIWRQLDAKEREIYEKKFAEEKQKYEQYVAEMLTIDPNFGKRNKISENSFFFPLHRVKAIMKQDSYYTTSTQNVTAMAKAVQYFGQYFLQEMKKVVEGKKRIDVIDLFETINNNQSTLWFLNCLIHERNMENQVKAHAEGKKSKTSTAHEHPDAHEQTGKKVEKTEKAEKHSTKKSKTDLPKGQLKLTDMF